MFFFLFLEDLWANESYGWLRFYSLFFSIFKIFFKYEFIRWRMDLCIHCLIQLALKEKMQNELYNKCIWCDYHNTTQRCHFETHCINGPYWPAHSRHNLLVLFWFRNDSFSSSRVFFHTHITLALSCKHWNSKIHQLVRKVYALAIMENHLFITSYYIVYMVADVEECFSLQNQRQLISSMCIPFHKLIQAFRRFHKVRTSLWTLQN